MAGGGGEDQKQWEQAGFHAQPHTPPHWLRARMVSPHSIIQNAHARCQGRG